VVPVPLVLLGGGGGGLVPLRFSQAVSASAAEAPIAHNNSFAVVIMSVLLGVLEDTPVLPRPPNRL
jgi:hypothetical protein